MGNVKLKLAFHPLILQTIPHYLKISILNFPLIAIDFKHVKVFFRLVTLLSLLPVRKPAQKILWYLRGYCVTVL